MNVNSIDYLSISKFIWYSSDLFYWYIYLSSLASSKLNTSNVLNQDSSCNVKTGNFLEDYFLFTKHVYLTIEEIIVLKTNTEKKILKFLKLKWTLKIIAFLLLAGAVGKFFINLNNCVYSLREIILIDTAILNRFKK
jgi:hypothetical protein